MDKKMTKLPYPTPHIKATPDDFAKTVLMPGDPLRSKFIAENFLENAHLVNNVRGVQGYTGTYHGVPVSVMASGMGMPSIGIYSNELYRFFGVENIIRVGSAGALAANVRLRDIILGMGACTDSGYAAQFNYPGTYAPICSYALLKEAADVCTERKLPAHIGNLMSSDAFYNARSDANEVYRSMGVLAVEMEAAALSMNAAYNGKNALAICTVSDHIFTGEALDADARQSSFSQMIELALEVAVRAEQK